MSCCSLGYCQFKFPEGPPLMDNAVANLNAKYQFLPYGTLLQEGEAVRIWMESGKTKTVVLEAKIPLLFDATGPKIAEVLSKQQQALIADPIPWQLIAFDSGLTYEDLMGWPQHPLYNPSETAVLVIYNHPIEVKPSLKMRWLQLLYKIRNLGR